MFKKLTEDIKQKILEQLKSQEFQDFLTKINRAEDTGTFEIIISTSDQDRQGEIIDQNGWELEHYKVNPVVLWAHDYNSLPIGVTKELLLKDGKLIARGKFAPEDANPFAQQVRKLYDLGIIRAASVGFIPKEYQGNIITRAELLEWSFVPVPANPQAVSTLNQLKLDIGEYITKGLLIEEKGAVASHTTPKAPEDQEWDADAATNRIAEWAGGPDKDKIDWNKYKEGFAWFDPENAENYGGYKLPHHDVIDGKLVVVWRGVAAAMAALMGARGGVDIPDKDWDGCYAHLAKHYEQFDKTPPEKAMTEQKIGRVLSEKNRTLIQNVIQQMNEAVVALKELLDATEPQGGDSSQEEKTKGRELAGKEYREYLAIKASLQIADKAIEETLRKMKEKLRKRYGR